MSSTNSQTSSDTQNDPPAFTILNRVGAIPVVSSSLHTINDVLTNHALTSWSYTHAKGVSGTALEYTKPLQIMFAPLIVRIDGYANKAVDVVEVRFPYPFSVQPHELTDYVRERKSSVHKVIDDKVTSPVIHVAQGIDQKFTPIVDYFEQAVSKLNNGDAGLSIPPDARYQYQRALALSKNIGENILSNDQVKHLQDQFATVQRASDTAREIMMSASTSVTSRVHTLSDSMIQELRNLQHSTSNFSASLQSGVHDLQHAYNNFSAAFSSSAHDLSAIVTEKDVAVQEKATRIGKEMQDRVMPLLNMVRKSISDVLDRSKNESANGLNSSSN